MKYLLIIFIFLLASCSSKHSVRRIIDGDTIVLDNFEHVRLAEIDAPESLQFYGINSKDYLVSLIGGKTIELKRKGKDRYRRTIGEIYYNGIWINEEMVLSGNAWSYRDQLISDQKKAQREHLGMWKYAGNIPPYIWRREHKR